MALVSGQIMKSHANHRVLTGVKFYFEHDPAVGRTPGNIPGAGANFLDTGRLRFASSNQIPLPLAGLVLELQLGCVHLHVHYARRKLPLPVTAFHDFAKAAPCQATF